MPGEIPESTSLSFQDTMDIPLVQQQQQSQIQGQGRSESPNTNKVSSAADAMLKLGASVPVTTTVAMPQSMQLSPTATGQPSQPSEQNSSREDTSQEAPRSASKRLPRNSRKQREFIPEFKKDEHYWTKRRKNNEAAKRSREKRRSNDVAMVQRILEVTNINKRMRKELEAIKLNFGLPVSQIFPHEAPEDDTETMVLDAMNTSDSDSSLSYAAASGVTVSIASAGLDAVLSNARSYDTTLCTASQGRDYPYAGCPTSTDPTQCLPPTAAGNAQPQKPLAAQKHLSKLERTPPPLVPIVDSQYFHRHAAPPFGESPPQRQFSGNVRANISSPQVVYSNIPMLRPSVNLPQPLIPNAIGHQHHHPPPGERFQHQRFPAPPECSEYGKGSLQPDGLFEEAADNVLVTGRQRRKRHALAAWPSLRPRPVSPDRTSGSSSPGLRIALSEASSGDESDKGWRHNHVPSVAYHSPETTGESALLQAIHRPSRLAMSVENVDGSPSGLDLAHPERSDRRPPSAARRKGVPFKLWHKLSSNGHLSQGDPSGSQQRVDNSEPNEAAGGEDLELLQEMADGSPLTATDNRDCERMPRSGRHHKELFPENSCGEKDDACASPGPHARQRDCSRSLEDRDGGDSASRFDSEEESDTPSGDSSTVDRRYLERRRRNNQAARKCRENRKLLNEIRLAKSNVLETENSRMRDELRQLQVEVSQLKKWLQKKHSAEASGKTFQPPPPEDILPEVQQSG